MPLAYLKMVLQPASRKRYAVGAFNVVDSYFLDAVLCAARELDAPVIINVAEAHFPFFDVAEIAAAIRARAAREQVDVVLHLDHGMSIASVQRAITCGFTSVMIDGSGLSLEENIRLTRETVALCKPRGISVEAELGVVGGEEGQQGGMANPDLYTKIEEARIFVRETGVDALAVAIGNVHGAYHGEPDLNFEQLDAIHKAVNLPLVLHGGSGISAEDFQRAISLGICKINFYTGLTVAAMTKIRNYLEGETGKSNNYPLMMSEIKQQMKEVVKENMRIFGCVGKSRHLVAR